MWTLIRRRVLHCLPMSLLWDARHKWFKALITTAAEEIRRDISCESSAKGAIRMKCQVLFFLINIPSHTVLLSAVGIELLVYRTFM